MTTEQAAQKALDERGYLVVASTIRLEIGSICPLESHPGTSAFGETQAIAVIIAETDRADLNQQLTIVGMYPNSAPEFQYFYRCIAE